MEAFQTFEYNGRHLQLYPYETASSTRPAKASALRVPGAGKFEIGQIVLSREGKDFTLTAQISGKNIAYIYTEILLKDKSLDQFYGPVAREYIQAEQNKETRGVSRPHWENIINLAVRLTPSLRLLTDGVDSAFAFLIPAGYDNSDYQIDSLYIPAQGGNRRRVRITFNSAGKLTDAVAYKEQGNSATPHALTFKEGDQFTPFVQILSRSTNRTQTWHVTQGLSTPLTFRAHLFRCVEEPLMPGDYLIGLLVQDLDGGFTRKYAPLTVSQ